jgi:hypothetical protein
MSILKKILLSIIIILFSFILFFLLQKRQFIIKTIQLQEGAIGIIPVDYNYIKGEVESVAMDPTLYSSGISANINSTTMKTPLNQLCIKASYNTAYSGKYISDIMVNYVLSRGCRFLDFEIYYLPDPSGNYTTCVGYSVDPTAINPTISNTENVLFADILQTTIQNAFIPSSSSTYTVTNTNDPLFIHLRLKTSKEDMNLLFQSIQTILKATSKDPKYHSYFTISKIDGGSVVSSIKQKVVIIFEKNEFIDLKDSQYNMISNTDTLTKSTYKQLDVKKYIGCAPKQGKENNVVFNCNHTFNLVVPDDYHKSQNNPLISTSIMDYGNQITMFQYYVNDYYLIEYENLFKTYNSSFVSLYDCMNYINQHPPTSNILPLNILGS